MKADIEQIGDEGLDFVSELSLPWLQEILGLQATYRPQRPGRLVAHLTRNDDVVVVQGDAQLELEANCARCLKEIPVAVHTPLEVTMVPSQSAVGASEDGQLSEDDVGLGTYEDGEIDVGAVVRDEVLLQLPMQVLCAENCRGLCPQCGRDLNQEACACQPTVGDVRLARLAQIKLA